MKKISTISSMICIFILVITMFMGCLSTAKISIYDGSKVISSDSSLKTKDFCGTNFFIKNIQNPYLPDFNEIIFQEIKNNSNSVAGKFSVYDEDGKPSYKEAVFTFEDKNEENVFTIVYSKCEELGCNDYYFALYIDDNEIKEYQSILNNIKETKSQITEAELIIANCSDQYIKKSKVVSVPYEVQERRWVPGNGGRRTNSSFGSSEGDEGHYEVYTRTVYKNERQYYSVQNPNYNPEKVKLAKKFIEAGNEVIEKGEYIIKNYPPFTLICLE